MARDMRLTDANELARTINKLDVFYFTGETDIQVHDCQMVELGGVLTAIDETPTVDAAPVVHAHWELREDVPGFARCSHCRDCNVYEDWPDGKKWNYCPNCGARMDGGTDHD